MDQQTDRPTDQRMDGRTDNVGYRVACKRLKIRIIHTNDLQKEKWFKMIKRNVKICEKITSCKKIVIEFYKKKKAKTQICKEKQNKI